MGNAAMDSAEVDRWGNAKLGQTFGCIVQTLVNRSEPDISARIDNIRHGAAPYFVLAFSKFYRVNNFVYDFRENKPLPFYMGQKSSYLGT